MALPPPGQSGGCCRVGRAAAMSKLPHPTPSLPEGPFYVCAPGHATRAAHMPPSQPTGPRISGQHHNRPTPLDATQGSPWGLLVYGLLVMALEFAPLGGVNPKEVAEYLAAINVGVKGVIPGVCVCVCVNVHACVRACMCACPYPPPQPCQARHAPEHLAATSLAATTGMSRASAVRLDPPFCTLFYLLHAKLVHPAPQMSELKPLHPTSTTTTPHLNFQASPPSASSRGSCCAASSGCVLVGLHGRERLLQYQQQTSTNGPQERAQEAAPAWSAEPLRQASRKSKHLQNCTPRVSNQRELWRRSLLRAGRRRAGPAGGVRAAV